MVEELMGLGVRNNRENRGILFEKKLDLNNLCKKKMGVKFENNNRVLQTAKPVYWHS